ncbi:MAG TPA: peptidoglycan-binding domain-containing protein [Terriglobales bacterium]|nr:peptidoglycan-binding domain-containing protein [Terriglobales bacterium]
MTGKRRKLPMLAGLTLLAASVSFASTTTTDQQSSHPATKSSHHVIHHKRSRKTKVRGQKAIDGERVRQIQQALAREHFLKGTPSGKWDASTQDAMRRFQAAQGWQTKTVPDSRALIRLGLGPDEQHLLNPESAMTTTPVAEHASAAAKSSAHASVPAGTSMSPSAAQVSTPAATLPSDPAH